MKVVVPDVKPPQGKCWKQKLTPPGAMTRCVYHAGHPGRHSWEMKHPEVRDGREDR